MAKGFEGSGALDVRDRDVFVLVLLPEAVEVAFLESGRLLLELLAAELLGRSAALVGVGIVMFRSGA